MLKTNVVVIALVSILANGCACCRPQCKTQLRTNTATASAHQKANATPVYTPAPFTLTVDQTVHFVGDHLGPGACKMTHIIIDGTEIEWLSSGMNLPLRRGRHVLKVKGEFYEPAKDASFWCTAEYE
jgi:hypothetical protein